MPALFARPHSLRFALACFAWPLFFVPTGASAQEAPAADSTAAPEEPPVEGPPRWRFRKDERPVKVIVLAGSIGARPSSSYAHHIESMCSSVELRNLSKTGYGAAKLAERFEQRALKNPYAKLNLPQFEYWMLFGGGLNSVGVPERSNHAIRKLFVRAHRVGFSVLALSLTPWGSDKDQRRWAGVAGYRYLQATQKMVDFVMGRLNPHQALGDFAKRRKGLNPVRFSAAELPDLAIDLFDSPLRHYSARTRKVESMRRQLARNWFWKKEHQGLPPKDREARLDRDAERSAAIPQFYLHPRLHSFDAIHPNAKGHKLMADLICPSLPKSWTCKCEPPALLPR